VLGSMVTPGSEEPMPNRSSKLLDGVGETKTERTFG